MSPKLQLHKVIFTQFTTLKNDKVSLALERSQKYLHSKELKALIFTEIDGRSAIFRPSIVQCSISYLHNSPVNYLPLCNFMRYPIAVNVNPRLISGRTMQSEKVFQIISSECLYSYIMHITNYSDLISELWADQQLHYKNQNCTHQKGQQDLIKWEEKMRSI